ncbi:MAG: HDIG domain-containing protein [Acidobacteriota bacterium]|nr:HDIG domain-containing protein [Acidobacteriota bacterium]
MNARRRRLRFTSRLTDARRRAVARLARAFNWFRPTTQFVVSFVLLTAVTTFLLARSRAQMPNEYREGEIVTSSVVAPTDMQIEDVEATQAARARNPDASPVMTLLKRNQIVARVGEPVTPKMMNEIEAIRRYGSHSRLPQHFVGLFFLVAALYWGAWKFIEHRALTSTGLTLSRGRAFTLVATVVVVEAALMRFGVLVAEGVSAFRGAPWNDAMIWSLAIPFASATLLVAILMDVQLALTTGLITTLFAGLLAPNNNVLVAFYSMVSSSAAIYGTGRYRERQSVTLSGLFVAAVNAFAAIAVVLAAQKPLTLGNVLLAMACGIVGGLLTLFFAAGGLPIYESVFGILTDVKLLELSNADLPVLGQMALRAPGTNQHSHAVGQLAEESARAIGANPLLARIGALYHDIGKLAAPHMFVENQAGDNPHDRLRPTNSARIVISHVTYGMKLAKEIGLPQKIVDFIPQHHGTRTLHFFLRKAQAQAIHGDQIDEAEFRYPGPKPQFKEAAIMMLADSCEAAARSLARPDPDNIRTIVNKIFEAIVSDGQLDECNLTLRELTAIRETITTSLVAIYHARIDYPGFNPPATGITSALPPLPLAHLDTEERGVSYSNPNDIPISKGGEVEDEAVTKK